MRDRRRFRHIGMAAFLSFMHRAASNTFQRVSPDQPVSLSGRDIIVYPNSVSGVVSANHLVVPDSNNGCRDLAGLVNGSMNGTDAARLVAGCTKAQPAGQGWVVTLRTEFASFRSATK